MNAEVRSAVNHAGVPFDTPAFANSDAFQEVQRILRTYLVIQMKYCETIENTKHSCYNIMNVLTEFLQEASDEGSL